VSDEKVWTVLELLRWTAGHFEKAGIDTPRLDAEVLLAHALETTRLKLYVDFEKPVTAEERARFREFVRRRASERVPVSQLVGHREFWSIDLLVSKDVLTPRPDTETLVEGALARLGEKQQGHRILDIGTGSGAIALALATEYPKAHVVATDISNEALQIAAANADRLQVTDRVELRQGDLFDPLAPDERFDLVASNPPYLARAEAAALEPELRHEPEEALFAGEDGLEMLRRLVAGAGGFLVSGGWLLLELAPGQADEIEAELTKAGYSEIEKLHDLARRPRVVAGRKP